MAATQQLSAAFIEVTTKGIEEAKKKIASVKTALFDTVKTANASKIQLPKLPSLPSFDLSGLTKLGEKATAVFGAMKASISQVGSIASIGFGMATAGIAGLVKMADPQGFNYFLIALQGISIQLGRIFVPILRDVTLLLIRVEGFLRSLTDAQRESILRFVETGVVVLGAVVALSKLFGVISTAFSVLSGFVAVLGAIGIATPIGWVIALTAAIVGLLAVVGGASGGFSGLFASIKPALDAILAAFNQCFAAIQPIIGVAMNGVVGLITKALGVVVPFISRFASIIADAWGKIAAVIMPIVSDLFGSLSTAWDSIKPALDGLIEQVLKLTEVFADNVVRLWQQYAPIVGDILTGAIPILAGFVSAMIEVQSAILNLLGPVINFVFSAIRMAADGFITNVNAMIGVMNGFIQWFNSSIFARATGQIGLIPQINTGPRPPRPEPGGNNPNSNSSGRRFVGEAAAPAPVLMGIAEAWRKAQTAAPIDPNTALLQQQLNQDGDRNQLLAQIRDEIQRRNSSQPNATFGN